MSCNTIILQNKNYPPAVPGELVGDDGPGQAGHGDVPDHPEGGQEAESAASLGAGLELCEICPDQRNAAAHSDIGEKVRYQLLLSRRSPTHPSPLRNLRARKVG